MKEGVVHKTWHLSSQGHQLFSSQGQQLLEQALKQEPPYLCQSKRTMTGRKLKTIWSRKDASPSVQVLLKSATNKMSEDVTAVMVGKTEDSEDVEDC